MTTEKQPGPKGVVAVLTDAQGHVWATATDFEPHGYGGFDLREAQEYRVSQALATAFVRAACSPIMLSVLEGYQAGEIVRKLVQHHGFKRTIIAVGHADE